MPQHDEYRKTLAGKMDDLLIGIVASGTANTAVIGSLISAVSGASAHFMDGDWIFNSNTSLQRVIRTGGGTASSGTVTFDPTMSPAPAANNVMLFTRLFPMVEDVRIATSYSTIINSALRRVRWPDRLTFTIVPNQKDYVFTQTWLNRIEQLGWPPHVTADGRQIPQPLILEPGPSGLPIPADWRRPRLRVDGSVLVLDLEVAFRPGAAGTLYVNVMRPGNTLSNGAEGTQLSLLTDTALPDVDTVTEIGKMLCYEILSTRQNIGPTGQWWDKFLAQREYVRGMRWYDDSLDRAAQQAPSAPARGAA